MKGPQAGNSGLAVTRRRRLGQGSSQMHDRDTGTIARTAWRATTSLSGLAGAFPILAAARAGMGVGEGGSNPAGMSLLSDEYPPARRPLVLALFSGAGMLGPVLSFAVGSWIAVHYGWRTV